MGVVGDEQYSNYARLALFGGSRLVSRFVTSSASRGRPTSDAASL